MKIAQIGPIWNRIPPPLYGGTERVADYLTEGLVKRGHKVTLFASGDSQTSATLFPTVKTPLYQMGIPWENVSYPLYHLTSAYDKAKEFDIIHVHLNFASDFISFPLAERTKIPSVFTVHFRFKEEEEDKTRGTHKVLLKYRHLNFVSISQAQRTLPLNFVATVYNGIPLEEFIFEESPKGDYLLWIGRIAPEKGAKEAIEVAKKLRLPIVLAGKRDAYDKRLQEYYQKEVAPLIDPTYVRLLGELDHQSKVELYKNAKILLFPLAWNEPFGLIMTEAMACGTPVIAYARGSVPEVVVDGVTGFIVEPNRVSERVRPLTHSRSDPKWVIKNKGIDGLVEAVRRITSLSSEEYRQMRFACRRHVDTHFTSEKMVEKYVRVYEKILSASSF